jgi:hypothetical protein
MPTLLRRRKANQGGAEVTQKGKPAVSYAQPGEVRMNGLAAVPTAMRAPLWATADAHNAMAPASTPDSIPTNQSARRAMEPASAPLAEAPEFILHHRKKRRLSRSFSSRVRNPPETRVRAETWSTGRRREFASYKTLLAKNLDFGEAQIIRVGELHADIPAAHSSRNRRRRIRSTRLMAGKRTRSVMQRGGCVSG